MSKPEVFHLGLTKAALKGATLAILPGDPARVPRIAALFDDPQPLASTREYTSYLGYLDGKPVVACSTGIGGPSTSIAVEELAQLGVRTFLRVGTTGAIQPDIEVGEMLVANGAVRLDGASHHFAPASYPAVANYECINALVAGAKDIGCKVRVGIAASSDTFYPGQERYDTYTGYVQDSLKGSFKQWQALKVTNFEMEGATLFTMCSTMGLRAGMIAVAIINRNQQEIPNPETIHAAEQNVVKAVVEATRKLI